MKILIINKFLFPNGGSESYIFRLGEELMCSGCEVQYFGMEHEGRIVGNRAESYTRGMDFHAKGMEKFLSPFGLLYSRDARHKLKKVLEDFRPDAVHLNNINFQLTPSVIDEVRAFDPGIKIVATAHDSQWMCPGHLLRIPSTGEVCRRCVDGSAWNCFRHRCIHDSAARSFLGSLEGSLYRMLNTYAAVDTVICPSAFMEEILSHHPKLKGRLRTLHNFVELPQASERTPGDYVLFFGRYSQEKGIRPMLSAVRALPEVLFVFAGKGELEDEVDAVAGETGNLKNAGFKSGGELRDMIRGARFVVFPSVCHENCPLSVMEAQAAGVPVIASRAGGIPELIDDGRTGELFTMGDADELADRIWALWNDDRRCITYGENAGKMAKERYLTPEAYAVEMIRLYSSRS
ncbi:MAG: glycosyltransferase family 4 protein [Lachnospiraceae bacterium]|nr:glycosyltransferase family 4 protein [Lachnospiraceae bacterium]